MSCLPHELIFNFALADANGIIVRALVEQRLQTTLTGEKKAFLDKQIDQELANM